MQYSRTRPKKSVYHRQGDLIETELGNHCCGRTVDVNGNKDAEGRRAIRVTREREPGPDSPSQY